MRATRRLVLIPLGLALGALLLFAAPSVSANDLDEEIETRIHRIEILVDEAQALEKQGHHDVARALHARVETLEKEVRALRGKAQKAERREREEEVEEELEEAARQGIGVLLRLFETAVDEDEEAAQQVAEKILRLAERVEEELEETAEEHAEKGPHGSREHLEHATELLRAAVKAFAEIQDEELVQVMEQAVHVHELLLEGAAKEAHQLVEEHDLTWGRVRKLLMKAAHLYAEWGREQTAEALQELAARGHEGKTPQRAKREGRMQHVEALERIERMQEKVEVVMGMAAGLAEELEELKREMIAARER